MPPWPPPDCYRSALQLPNSAYRPGRTNRFWNCFSRRLRVITQAMATRNKKNLCTAQRQCIHSVGFVVNCCIHLCFTTSPTVPGTPQRIVWARLTRSTREQTRRSPACARASFWQICGRARLLKMTVAGERLRSVSCGRCDAFWTPSSVEVVS